MNEDNPGLSSVDAPRGISREDLRARYDVPSIIEDKWHSYTSRLTTEIVRQHLTEGTKRGLLLNAGCGVYPLRISSWVEVALDIFLAPLYGQQHPVCSTVEQMPFRHSVFDAVVCVGEVLAYCDPARAISEFARVTSAGGLLVLDFGNSHSFRHWFTGSAGRHADLVTVEYNNSPERTWVYSTHYISSLVQAAGFSARDRVGIHTWSALARRLGASTDRALALQRYLGRLPLPARWADTITIVAEKS